MIRFFFWLVCSVAFLMMIMKVWSKFNSGFTTTAVNFVVHDGPTKLLPCITVNPFVAFKQKGFHYTTKSYLENTYRKNP